MKEEEVDKQGASYCRNKAIEINPHYNKAYHFRGLLKIKMKDYQGAIADFNNAADIQPVSNVGKIDLGKVNENQNDHQLMLGEVTKALYKVPSKEKILLLKALLRESKVNIGDRFNDMK